MRPGHHDLVGRQKFQALVMQGVVADRIPGKAFIVQPSRQVGIGVETPDTGFGAIPQHGPPCARDRNTAAVAVGVIG